MSVQGELFAPSVAQRFEAWKATPGGRHMLSLAYRVTAGFVPRFLRTGQQVSMDYVWHILRYRLDGIRGHLKRKGVKLAKEGGYKLNNDFTAYVARHVMEHRPEWRGIFELRQCGRERVLKRVVVLEYQGKAKAA